MNQNEKEFNITSVRIKLSGGMCYPPESSEYIFDLDGNVTYSIDVDKMIVDQESYRFTAVIPEMTNELFKYLKRVDFYNKFKNELYNDLNSYITDIPHYELELEFYYRTEKYDLRNLDLKTTRNLFNNYFYPWIIFLY